jgi:hypothetical protein
MPRRELLTSTERAGLLAFPTDESELIRLATLSAADVTFIRHHRGHHNRLGIAVQMQYLRFPGRVLAPSERPHPGVLGILAAQVRAAPAAWDLYATRDETRREHLQEGVVVRFVQKVALSSLPTGCCLFVCPNDELMEKSCLRLAEDSGRTTRPCVQAHRFDFLFC